jgi:hypothetical protein
MDRATDRLEQHLQDERRALRSNLEELEDRVRSAVDWRRQFRSNMAAFLGLALGGGLLIGLMTARRTAVPAALKYPTTPAGGAAPRYSDARRRELSPAWQGIERALIGVAAAILKNTLANMLPGFRAPLAGRGSDSYQRDSTTRYRS